MMRFCPSCGNARESRWQFCAHCGAALGAGTVAAPGRTSSSVAGTVVFCVLAFVGVGAWVQILTPRGRQGPPGSPTSSASATEAGAVGARGDLPEGHPPIDKITLPDDVKTFIADLAAETEKRPQDVGAWEKLSGVQYRAARVDQAYYEGALGSYGHLLEIAPGNATALRGIANVHYDLGEYREAEPYFQRFLALQPNDAGARTDLATVHLNLGDLDRAIKEYRTVIENNPAFVQAHYNLGVALHRQGDKPGALAAFRRTQQVAPDDRTRERVGQLIAQLEGHPGSGSDDRGRSPSPAAGRTSFQATVEKFFRTHNMIGPKVVSIEWPAALSARVVVRDFPMDSMPPFARTAFTNHLRGLLREAKQTDDLKTAATVAIVNSATRSVMETVRE